MSSDENHRLEALFDKVFDLDGTERAHVLSLECGRDEGLRNALEQLLQAARLYTLTSARWAPVAPPADATPRAEPQPGQCIGRYTVVRELGRGGMGVVYLARDAQLDRHVAIKLLLQDDPTLSERFLVEARATARCNHENIVVIHEVGEHDGYPYMVLEYLRGQTLRQWLRAHDGPVAPERAIALLLPVVRALARAHASDIVHRDLKPENILVTEEGTVKVLDFGIAKMVADVYASTIAPNAEDPRPCSWPLEATRKGALLGTLPYMSPEQWAGDGIDAQSDLWAVGVILYEMLAGKHPLAPLSTAKLEEVRDLDIAMPDASEATREHGELADVINHCLTKNKKGRITRAIDVIGALERAAARLDMPAAPYATIGSPSASLANPNAQQAQDPHEPARPPKNPTSPDTASSGVTRRRWPFLVGSSVAALVIGAFIASRLYCSAMASGQQQFYAGTVLRLPDSAPLQNVSLLLVGTSCMATTTDRGHFEFAACDEAARLKKARALITPPIRKDPCATPFKLHSPPALTVISIDFATCNGYVELAGGATGPLGLASFRSAEPLRPQVVSQGLFLCSKAPPDEGQCYVASPVTIRICARRSGSTSLESICTDESSAWCYFTTKVRPGRHPISRWPPVTCWRDQATCQRNRAEATAMGSPSDSCRNLTTSSDYWAMHQEAIDAQ